ncbi:MAG: hypothetical protein OJF48_003507 [Afipia sp.]|nr:MAG: hypothetical protein OJF48_003507 [Afipia sp.]
MPRHSLMFFHPKSDDDPKSSPKSSPNLRTGRAELYVYLPGRGTFHVQDVAGMWLKYGAKP